MKKVLSILLAFVLVFSLAACGDEDTTGKDISNLQALLAELQAEVDALESALEDIEIPGFTLDLGSLTLEGGELTESLALPTLENAEIIWTSSDSTVLTSTGEVIRPSATRGDVEVTLTAIVLDGNLAATKSFVFTVMATDLTDEERVRAALDAIDIPAEVTEDVALPTNVEGAMIVWETSKPDYLSVDGSVSRPHYDFANEEVLLTAYVSAGKELRMFQQTVSVLKMDYAEHGSVGNPFTVSLTTQDGHVLYIPVENIDVPEFNANEVFPFIYTPEFGERIPSNVNGWGLAIEIAEDGTLRTVYDGISGVKRTAEGEESWKNGDGFAKDPESCELDEDDNIIWETCLGLEIPEDGYIIVFFNSSAGNTKNNREFARTYLNTMEVELTVENLTLTPSTMQFEVRSGVWWRGNATVSVPLAFINPDVNNYPNVVLLDENDMQIGGSPVIFTKSYASNTGVAELDVLDILNGWGIAAEITPETRTHQQIGAEGEEVDFELITDWRITRVYDGIGGSIKNPLPEGNVPIGGGDYGKNIRLPEAGFVAVFPNVGYGYGSDQDVLNRRIAADYFYHLDNWVFSPVLVAAEGLQGVVRSSDWD